MTEEEARGYLKTRYDVSRETLLERYVALLIAATREQNLISALSVDAIWDRHIVDSAQLVPLAPERGTWLDVGSGAGLPGIVVAILRDAPTVLIEPRRRRVEFLHQCVAALGLKHVSVVCAKVEATRGQASVISARAVATPSALFKAAGHWAETETTWILPRGRSGYAELAETRKAWQGEFHVEQSLTSPESLIIVARKVRRK